MESFNCGNYSCCAVGLSGGLRIDGNSVLEMPLISKWVWWVDELIDLLRCAPKAPRLHTHFLYWTLNGTYWTELCRTVGSIKANLSLPRNNCSEIPQNRMCVWVLLRFLHRLLDFLVLLVVYCKRKCRYCCMNLEATKNGTSLPYDLHPVSRFDA